MALAELGRYPNGAEAEMVRARLMAEDIHAVCFDAGMNIADSVGIMIPVRVMVDADDLGAAQNVLDSIA